MYIQFSKGSEAQANRPKEILRKKGFRIPEAEMAPKVPNYLQARHCRADQRHFTEQLSKDIAIVMGVPAIVEIVARTKPLPAGILEVWLLKKQ